VWSEDDSVLCVNYAGAGAYVSTVSSKNHCCVSVFYRLFVWPSRFGQLVSWVLHCTSQSFCVAWSSASPSQEVAAVWSCIVTPYRNWDSGRRLCAVLCLSVYSWL